MRKIVIAAALLAGCAHAYQAEITTIGNGRYMIRSAPEDEQVSESIATQYALRRAGEVCATGYEVLESKTGVATSTEHVAVFGRRTTELPEVTLVVRCRTP
jgi:hypothetical protein